MVAYLKYLLINPHILSQPAYTLSSSAFVEPSPLHGQCVASICASYQVTPMYGYYEVASVCLEYLAHIYSIIMAVLKLSSCSYVSDAPCSSLRCKDKSQKLPFMCLPILTAVMRKQFTSELDGCCFILL